MIGVRPRPSDDPAWRSRHDAAKREIAKNGGAKHKVLRIGGGGEKIENILWRMLDGEMFAGGRLAGVEAEKVELDAGTSDLECHSADEVAAGICMLLDFLRAALPDAKIRFVPIASDDAKARIVNAAISRF